MNIRNHPMQALSVGIAPYKRVCGYLRTFILTIKHHLSA